MLGRSGAAAAWQRRALGGSGERTGEEKKPGTCSLEMKIKRGTASFSTASQTLNVDIMLLRNTTCGGFCCGLGVRVRVCGLVLGAR